MKQIVKDKIEGYLEYRKILKHLENANLQPVATVLPEEVEERVRNYLDTAPTDTYAQQLRKGRIFDEYVEYKYRDWLKQSDNERVM